MENKINIYLIVFFLSFVLFVTAIILLFFQYRDKQKMALKRRALLEKEYEQKVLQNQINTQTQTMHFIGREIHDNVGQKLTLASLYAKQLLNSNNTAAEKINTIGNIIDESLADLRQLSKSLTNPAIAHTSLTHLLHDEAVKINSLGNCIVTITDNASSIQLQPAQKNILFRLLQEFIQNSLKHADCTKITITLRQQENSFTVKAADNGKGFNILQTSAGQGLANMKRRAEELHAVFSLQSAKETGTEIYIAVPLNQINEI